MNLFQFVFRDKEGNKHTNGVTEEQARELLAPVSHNVDEAIRVMIENPGGQMNCEGGYLRYAR